MLSLAYLIREVAIEVCDIEADQLQKLVEKCHVVISTVGPYQSHGEPMFQACAKAGTHYIDWFVRT
jgi:short subunit dehydrogenase-like uncharacterized protein